MSPRSASSPASRSAASPSPVSARARSTVIASSMSPRLASRSASRSAASSSPVSARARSPSVSPRSASSSASRRAAYWSPVSARARSSLDVAPLGQQLGQPIGGVLVAGVGPGPQQGDRLLGVAPLDQQLGQPLGGEPVAGLGGTAEQGDGVAVEQAVGGGRSELPGVEGGFHSSGQLLPQRRGYECSAASLTSDLLEVVGQPVVQLVRLRCSGAGPDAGQGLVGAVAGLFGIRQGGVEPILVTTDGVPLPIGEVRRRAPPAADRLEGRGRGPAGAAPSPR